VDLNNPSASVNQAMASATPVSRLWNKAAQAQGSPPVAKVDARLQHLEQLAAVGMLSTTVAHEIRNAMVAVRTFVELLASQNSGNELAEVVGREIVRIDSMVAQMLRLSAAPAVNRAETGVNRILTALLALLEPRFRQHRIIAKPSLRAESDIVIGNSPQLEQACLNILLNAMDALAEGGEILVSTAIFAPGHRRGENGGDARKLHITIQDTGPGIPAEQQNRLFDPFFTTKPNGTGLGLAIARQIIEQHEGRISVESNLGKGTAFHILLPLHSGPNGL
jgi:signal transduction histidine kinase